MSKSVFDFNTLMSIRDVSHYCDFSERHIRLLLEKGKIRGKRIGRDWITTSEEVDKYLVTNPKPGPKPK